MVKVSVEIFEEEDRIVARTKERYGLMSKNDALNFIIRNFEKHLKKDSLLAFPEIINDVMTPAENAEKKQSKVSGQISREKVKPLKKKDKKRKKLNEEKEKQSLDLLKNILTER